MPKEYDDIKKEYASKHPDWDEKKVKEVSAKVFYKIFGITVNEATSLEKEGKWKSYLKSHKSESKSCEFGTCFTNTTFEMKSKGDDIYVSGFVSAPIPDESGEYVDQQQLLNKLLDENNYMSKNLSYNHGWLKGDKNDAQVFGVLQKAELKEHPQLHKPAVWAEYKLIKTHPYFEKAVYELKENALKGFSIEFKAAKKQFVKIGSVLVKKIMDYVLGGVALVGRPMQQLATLTGYVAKDYSYLEGGSNMEFKEEEQKNEETNEAQQEQQESKQEEKTQEATQKTESNDEQNKQEDDKSIDEIEKLKKELADLKLAQANEQRQKEIAMIKEEIAKLKPQKKVLVDESEQNFKNQEPDLNPINEEAQKIVDDKNLSIQEKLAKIAELDFKNKNE